MLNAEEVERYSRHILLDAVGEAGQIALKNSRVLIVGAGGLAAPVAIYLAAAGVGTLGIVDDDVVELSNLQRQILFGKEDLGIAKASAVASRIAQCNGNVKVQTHAIYLQADNAPELIDDYNLVIDCTDNFATRYVINDACLAAGKPFVYGSIYRFEGQVSVFCASNGPCYRCLFPEANAAIANCAEAGVLGVLPGVIGCLQATEALKMLLDLGEMLVGRLLLYDALNVDFKVLKLAVAKDCLCRRIHDHTDLDRSSNLANDVVNCSAKGTFNSITPEQLKIRFDSGELMELVDVRTAQENRAMRLQGSKLIPVDEFSQHYNEINRELPVVLYCRSGIRSKRAARELILQGFTQVYNLSSGLLGWYSLYQDNYVVSDLNI